VRFDVVTLFPETLAAVSASGITRRALEQGLWQLAAWNPRDFTTDAHRTVDDRPFGGGPGMVMLAEPLALAVEAARAAQRAAGAARSRVVVLSAAGRRWRDADAKAAATASGAAEGLVLVCGRYEGIDQRFIDACADDEVSIGDYVISGGELAAMVLIDSIVRQLPGALKQESVARESFADGGIDGPQYTRPETWRGQPVPPVLLSGHHADIERWRREQATRRTAARRPDLHAAAAATEFNEQQVRGDARRRSASPGGTSIIHGNDPSSGRDTPHGAASESGAASSHTRATMA